MLLSVFMPGVIQFFKHLCYCNDINANNDQINQMIEKGGDAEELQIGKHIHLFLGCRHGGDSPKTSTRKAGGTFALFFNQHRISHGR